MPYVKIGMDQYFLIDTFKHISSNQKAGPFLTLPLYLSNSGSFLLL